jgi:hypothetical protein
MKALNKIKGWITSFETIKTLNRDIRIDDLEECINKIILK